VNTVTKSSKKDAKINKVVNNDKVENDCDAENEDDINEKKERKQYIKIIRGLSKYNKNVYLSATIDEQHDFEFYKKDIRKIIDDEYLSDYVIKVPIFSDDPSNKKICEYLVKNYRNIILYCHTRKEGQSINKIMNEVMPNSCAYVDCKTSKRERDTILEKYKNGTIPFLVNVRVLVEGF